MNINSIKEFDGYIEDYLNFQFGDIQLHFITKYSPSFLKLSEENRLRIKSHFNKMLQFLETSLAQLSVPYLQSTFNHYLNKLASKIEQQYFLMFLFGNEKLISTYLNTFFIKLIKITNFSLNGVIDQIPDYYIESPEFTTFIELIGEWNCLNEFVILYLDLINKYYKNIFYTSFPVYPPINYQISSIYQLFNKSIIQISELK